jgi:general secretion pathway protein K
VQRRSSKRRASQRGSILIAVLFLSGLLGIFGAVAASVMKAAADSSRVFAESVRADEAMRSAIEYIVARTGSSLAEARGVAVVGVGRTNVGITLKEETARIDINRASPEFLANIFTQVGVAPETARMYAARVVDWRDADDKVTGSAGAERGNYRGAGRTDGPRNGKFLHVAELALVLGLPARVAAAIAPYVTVVSNKERVNPMLADPPVLAAIPGMTQQRVAEILDLRRRPGATFKSLQGSLSTVQDFVTDEPAAAVRFEGRVQLSRASERRYEVVVSVIEGDMVPYRILAWDANPPDRIRNLPAIDQ